MTDPGTVRISRRAPDPCCSENDSPPLSHLTIQSSPVPALARAPFKAKLDTSGQRPAGHKKRSRQKSRVLAAAAV